MTRTKNRCLSLVLTAAMLCLLMVFTAPTASAAGYDGNPALAALQADLYESSATATVTMTADITIGEGENSNGSNPKQHTITKVDGISIAGDPTAPSAGDALVITGDALDDADWKALKSLSVSVHLYLGGDGADVPKSATENGNYLSISGTAATAIGERAFYKCTSLTTVSLPKATDIGGWAFHGCSSLATLSLPDATHIGSSAFWSCPSLTTVSLPNATNINANAFQDCSALTTLSLPQAQSIVQGTFRNCSSLTNLSLPQAQSIGISAFNGCSSLTTVSLPKVTNIGDSAFNGCSSLTSLSLPKAKSIGSYAFNECSSLTTFFFGAISPTVDSKAIIGQTPTSVTYYYTGGYFDMFTMGGHDSDAISRILYTPGDYNLSCDPGSADVPRGGTAEVTFTLKDQDDRPMPLPLTYALTRTC